MWWMTGNYQVNPEEDEGDEGGGTLRYRKVYRSFLQPNQLDIPQLLTDVGIDGLITNRPGPDGKGWICLLYTSPSPRGY